MSNLSRRAFVAGTLATVTASCSKGFTAPGWQLYEGNPIIGGDLGVCFDAAVLREADLYRLWFSWRTKHGLAYVESRDRVNWGTPELVLEPNHVNPGEIDVNRPTVLVRDGMYHMWYTSQTEQTSSIFHSASPDGRRWTHELRPALTPEAAWEKTSVMSPHVLWEPSIGLYRMWYSAGEQYEPDAVGLAESSDGIVWRRVTDQPVFGPDKRFEWEAHKATGATIIKADNWYYAFYIGFADVNHAGIGIARSRDGQSGWQRHPNNPVIRAPRWFGWFEWDKDAVYKPAVLLDDNGWSIWFNGRRRAIEQIGLATRRERDLGFDL